jgi:hypothetical protein
MFVVRLDDGGCALFEFMGDFDLQVGARLQGALDAVGEQTLLDVGRGESFQAVGQTGPGHCASVLLRIAK